MTKKKIYIIGGAAIVLAIVLLSVLFLTSKDDSEQYGATYEVKQGPLTISFTESGTIKAKDQVILKSEVEGSTSIISIVPEGSRVKKGDLLVELDASTLSDNKIDQEISVQNAEASYISSKESLAVAENQAQSDIDVAVLTLDFAQQDLRKYIDGEYPYELDKANSEITLAEEELTKADETLTWSKKLFEQNYISKTELQADQLSKDEKLLDLELAKKSKNLLVNYTYKRQVAELQSDVNQAVMALERTKRKAHADVIQAQADLKAKEAEFERQKDKLTKLNDQIIKAKIYAPSDGQVIYATSARSGGPFRGNTEPLDVGSSIQERQELIYLPSGNSSKAEITIHEAYLKKTSKGMPVVVTIDALPGKTYFGTVATIAPLPDAQSMWMNPDLKIYNSDVYIDGNDLALRTGMSCQAEIIVQKLKNVIYVPLQAVVRVGSAQTVYVKKGNKIEARTVQTGLDNNKMIHITEGLEDGDIILLTPPLKSTASGEQNLSRSEQNGEGDTDGIQQKISQGLKNVEDNKNSTESGEQSNHVSESQETLQTPDAQKMEEMRKKFENITDEEKEQMKKKFENMSDEEKENLRKQFGGKRPSGSKKPNETQESQQ